MLKEALLYNKLKDKKVSCYLCSHYCLIENKGFGLCQIRENRDGLLYTHAYGEVVAANVDPIEKKPIFHLLPGSKSFSIAAIGCNFRCGFCQNWQISQKQEAQRLGVTLQELAPEEIVRLAKKNNCRSISYTYTEPTIFFEYAYEIAAIASKHGLYNIFVTNGYMTKEALKLIHPYLDAANVDLKFFDDAKYRRVCSGRLLPVLESIRLMSELKIWVEVTTLIVTGLNDSTEELTGIAKFLAGICPDIPWHVSRFHPDYQMSQLEPTPLSKIKEAYEIGRAQGLRYVYIGNVMEEAKTFCYNCNKELISRAGFNVIKNEIKDSKCPHCSSLVSGREL